MLYASVHPNLSDVYACFIIYRGTDADHSNAAFTRSNRSARLSARLSVRQLDARLYGQTVNTTGWNDSRMDVYLIQLSARLSDRLSVRQLDEHLSMWQSSCYSAHGYL